MHNAKAFVGGVYQYSFDSANSFWRTVPFKQAFSFFA
jgi:hypothetical protein